MISCVNSTETVPIRPTAHEVILVPDLSGTRNLDRIEHALLLPSFWYEILVPVTWSKLGSCAIGLI